MPNPSEQFISEAISPMAGTFDTQMMARGEAGLPSRFTWRQREYQVAELLEKWKGSGPSPDGEIYLRRHWFRVRTTGNEIMTIYCERQPKPGRTTRRRWWLYTIETKVD